MILIPLITPLHVLSSDMDHILVSCHRVVWFPAVFRMSWYARFMISSLFLHHAVIVHIISYTSYYYTSRLIFSIYIIIYMVIKWRLEKLPKCVEQKKIELCNSKIGMISKMGICNTNYILK